MNPIGSLDWETFEAQWSTIATEVRTILAAKGPTLRRFRIMAVYERSTDELVGQILRTTLGPVVVAPLPEIDLDRKVEKGTAIVHDFRLARGKDRVGLLPFTGSDLDMYPLRSHARRYPIFCKQFVSRDYPGLTFR